jgi:hypothetical protein
MQTSHRDENDPGRATETRTLLAEHDRATPRMTEKCRDLLRNVEKTREFLQNDGSLIHQEEKIIPARRCADHLRGDGPSIVRTAAMPPASLRLLERSPDALRVIHFIPRPRTMSYIRSGALDGAFYTWIS